MPNLSIYIVLALTFLLWPWKVPKRSKLGDQQGNPGINTSYFVLSMFNDIFNICVKHLVSLEMRWSVFLWQQKGNVHTLNKICNIVSAHRSSLDYGVYFQNPLNSHFLKIDLVKELLIASMYKPLTSCNSPYATIHWPPVTTYTT